MIRGIKGYIAAWIVDSVTILVQWAMYEIKLTNEQSVTLDHNQVTIVVEHLSYA